MKQVTALLLLIATTASIASPKTQTAAQGHERRYRDTHNIAFLWLAAEAYAAAGQKGRAIDVLKRIVGKHSGLLPTFDSPLATLGGDPAYERLLARLAAENPPVRRERQAIIVSAPRLVPEGVAADPTSARLFLGDSVNRRVLIVLPNGRWRVFAETRGLLPLGMKVERKAGLLWVAATTSFLASLPPRTALLAFDVRTGRLVRTETSPELRSMNDLAIAPQGDIYVTDSLAGAVFRLEHTGLRRVTPAGDLSYPNGIAVSGDGRSVFIAEVAGVQRLDLATGKLAPLIQPPGLSTMGLDGLYWCAGGLVGVQNSGNPGRVLRLRLSADQRRIAGYTVLEQGHPDFDVPTTGTLRGRSMYLLANSQISRLGDDGKIKPGPRLKPIKLLRIPLRCH